MITNHSLESVRVTGGVFEGIEGVFVGYLNEGDYLYEDNSYGYGKIKTKICKNNKIKIRVDEDNIITVKPEYVQTTCDEYLIYKITNNLIEESSLKVLSKSILRIGEEKEYLKQLCKNEGFCVLDEVDSISIKRESTVITESNQGNTIFFVATPVSEVKLKFRDCYLTKEDILKFFV